MPCAPPTASSRSTSSADLRPRSQCEEVDHRRVGLAVLDEERVAAVEPLDASVGQPRGHGLLVRRWRDAVVATGGDQHGHGHRRQPVPAVVVAAGQQLGDLTRRLVGRRTRRRPWPRSPRGPAACRSGSALRVSRASTQRARRCAGSRPTSSCRGNDAPPSPPGDVHASTTRSNRSGALAAASWRTMPPKLTPTATAPVPAERGRAGRAGRCRSRPWMERHDRRWIDARDLGGRRRGRGSGRPAVSRGRWACAADRNPTR